MVLEIRHIPAWVFRVKGLRVNTYHGCVASTRQWFLSPIFSASISNKDQLDGMYVLIICARPAQQTYLWEFGGDRLTARTFFKLCLGGKDAHSPRLGLNFEIAPMDFQAVREVVCAQHSSWNDMNWWSRAILYSEWLSVFRIFLPIHSSVGCRNL